MPECDGERTLPVARTHRRRLRTGACANCVGARYTGFRVIDSRGQTMNTGRYTLALLLAAVTGGTALGGDEGGYLDKLKDAAGLSSSSEGAGALSDDQMVAGLKEALDQGTQFAVKRLGRDGGFLKNKNVRIPMPESLSWAESSLRTLGQDQLADDFIASMNHAAERAVPEAAAIFGESIKQMSVEDAKGILTGPDDAATQYFRRTAEDALTEKMRPIVEEATASAGVTSAYKDMMSKAGGMTSMLSGSSTDLDGYVTDQTLDGLFFMVAKQEKKIRKDPLARSTELLQQVFGASQ